MNIIGIRVVKNEDIFIEQVILNVLDFVTKIIVLDNGSEDNTVDIVKNLCRLYKNISLANIPDCLDTLSYIQEYVGTNSWLFLVDGDEIFDPSGLNKLRKKLKSGKYKKYWKLQGYYFHCCYLDQKRKQAKGFFGPPSKVGSKLTNLSLVKEWRPDGKTVLTHPSPVFKEKKQPLAKKIQLESVWETCMFRCLHTRFIKRSTLDYKEEKYCDGRFNPSDILKVNSEEFILDESLKELYVKDYRKKYRLGKISKIKTNEFFKKKKKIL